MTRSPWALPSGLAVAAAFVFAGDLVAAGCEGNDLLVCRSAGDRFALITWVRAGLGVPIIAFWWRPRFPGVMALRSVLLWAPFVVVFWTAAAFASYWLGDEAFVAEVVRSSRPWLLLSAAMMASPILEEMVFRGVLFDAMRGKSIPGAVVLTSGAWVLVHGQYGAATGALLFAMGMALSTMRWLSGSLLIPIVMHAGWNGWVLFAAGVRL